MDWFIGLAGGFQGSAWLQGLAAALCTFVLEDPTTVGSGLLVSQGAMSYRAALIGLIAGIALGDFGLYWLGRLAQGRVSSWGLVDDEKLARAEDWFQSNTVSTVLAARFLPGMRLPTYVAAGVLRAHPLKFLASAAAASTVWTFLLLALSMELGETVLHQAGRWKWPLDLGLAAFLAAIQWYAARRRLIRKTPAAEAVERGAPPATSFF